MPFNTYIMYRILPFPNEIMLGNCYISTYDKMVNYFIRK